MVYDRTLLLLFMMIMGCDTCAMDTNDSSLTDSLKGLTLAQYRSQNQPRAILYDQRMRQKGRGWGDITLLVSHKDEEQSDKTSQPNQASELSGLSSTQKLEKIRAFHMRQERIFQENRAREMQTNELPSLVKCLKGIVNVLCPPCSVEEQVESAMRKLPGITNEMFERDND